MCTCKHKRSFSTLNRKENFIPSLYIESFIFAAEAELDLISSCDPTQYLTWYFSVKAIRLLDIEIPDCSTLSTEEDKYKLSQTQLKLILKVRKALIAAIYFHVLNIHTSYQIKFDPFWLHWSSSPSTSHAALANGGATLMKAKWIKHER